MINRIENEKPTEWMLVKVPRITRDGDGADTTTQHLRMAVRENQFGGETATVRRLTRAEIASISAAKKA
jgi:hypothetical protein